MANGKKNSLITAKYYAKKKQQHLLIVWTALVLFVSIFVFLFITTDNESLIYTIALIELIIMFFLLLLCKSRISFYDMHYRYYTLLSTSFKAEKNKCHFDEKWLASFKSNGYILHIDNDFFTIFYKINKNLVNKTFSRTNVIEIINIIKMTNLDLYADEINDEYKKIWNANEKEYRINKQVIIQFKKYEEYDHNIKKELDKIISFKERNNYLITINCGYFTKGNTIYYLHSDSYAPNSYYQYGVDLVKEIISW